ncbi:11762_t:CDS:2 [Acaulospora colombiana]|uniref:11762_t:CDS:1 n=1 Tax=Acaulospora colombiana TaxID=27376 RepID=A0ACA9KJL6_9GLOM|nr:11762_t:CDS:2 [Acaulospora colombiana]
MSSFSQRVGNSNVTRGRSLSADLRLLVNNHHYSDLEILCKDGVILHGIRSLLAARSHTMEQILYSSSAISSHPPTPRNFSFPKDHREKYPSTKDIYEKYIVFPDINSTSMIQILEYLYTGSISMDALNMRNAIEMYYAAEYFQLDQLATEIEGYLRRCVEDSKNESKIPELLSKALQLLSHIKSSSDVDDKNSYGKSSLIKENRVIGLLMEVVSNISLDSIEVGALSLNALQCLLSHTFDAERFTITFASSEYSLLRYSILISAKNVSYEAFTLLERHLPKWNYFASDEEAMNENKDEGGDSKFKYREKAPHIEVIRTIRENYSSSIYKALNPLAEFIDLRRINGRILADWIEPLGVMPSAVIMEAFKYHLREKKSLLPYRGMMKSPVNISPRSLQSTSASSTLISGSSIRSSISSHHTRSSSSSNITRDFAHAGMQGDPYIPHVSSIQKGSSPKVVQRFFIRKNSEPTIVPLQRFSVRKDSACILSNPPRRPSLFSQKQTNSLSSPTPNYTPLRSTITYDLKWSTTAIGGCPSRSLSHQWISRMGYHIREAIWICVCRDNGNFVHGQKVFGNISSIAMNEKSKANPSTTGTEAEPVEFKRGTVVTVHLDMELKKVGFSVDGQKYPDVEWDDLPAKLYPFVIVKPNNQVRIQSRVSI